MKKVFIFLIIVLIPFMINSQITSKKRVMRGNYISLSLYKKKFDNKLTKKDSLNFIFKNNDTLVKLPDDFKLHDGVKVPYEFKDSVFLEIYKDVVYKKHHPSKKNINKLTMRLWKDSIKIYFTQSVDSVTKKELIKFAKQLSDEVDSLKVTIVNNIEKSNYLVYEVNSTNNYQYEPRIKSNRTDYYLFWDKKQKIYNCRLQIFNKGSLNQKGIISKRRFFESLGKFNYTMLLSKESLLSSLYSNNKKLTNLDLEILKYHYSYGICKGTKLDKFEEQHGRAQKLLQKGKTLHFMHLNDKTK